MFDGLANMLKERLGLGGAPASQKSTPMPRGYDPNQQQTPLMHQNAAGLKFPSSLSMDSPIARGNNFREYSSLRLPSQQSRGKGGLRMGQAQLDSITNMHPQPQYGNQEGTTIQGAQNPGYVPFQGGLGAHNVQPASQYDDPNGTLQAGRFYF